MQQLIKMLNKVGRQWTIFFSRGNRTKLGNLWNKFVVPGILHIIELIGKMGSGNRIILEECLLGWDREN